jgi:outer membrane receptor for ferrienterochelin and colicins
LTSARTILLTLTIVSPTLTSLAVAQRPDTSANRPAVVLDPVVVTAERRPSPASDATAPVIVLDRSDIARRAASDLTTVLQDAPGVQLEAVVGSGAGLYLQGLGSDRVLVLLDGAPVAGRLNGQFDLSRLSPAQVQRIEIVEGPQSTLYGSTALGGVVNVITRRDALPGARLTTTAGSFGQRDVSARLASPVGGFVASLEGGHRTVDAVPGAFPGTTGGAARWDWMGRVSGNVGSAALDARVMATSEDQHYTIAPIPPATSPDHIYNDNLQYDGLAQLTLGASGRTDLRLHGSWYDHRFVDSPTADPSGASPSWDRQRIADLEVVRRGGSGPVTWVAGAKADREWLLSERVRGYSRSASTGALYASAEWALTRGLRASAGMRFTESEIWGADLSPRIGALLRAPGGLYLKGGVARGFRAPSFSEMYFDLLQAQYGYAVHGNAGLRPEQSWNGTAEVGVARPRAHLYLQAFTNRLRGFIETALASDSSGIAIYTYQNIGHARTGGVQVGASATRGIATASAAVTWLSTRDIDNNTDLLGRAARTANGSLTLGRGGWSLRGDVVYTGRTPVARSQAGVVSYQGAFTRVNTNGTAALGRDLSITLGADDLTDARPRDAALTYGRRVYAQFDLGLGW